MPTTATWTSGSSADWNTPSDWSGNVVPNSGTADALINAAGNYTISIASGEHERADAVTLSASGATLAVTGTLDFASGTSRALNAISGAVVLNGGTISAARSVGGLVAGKGEFTDFSGTLVNNGTIDANGGPNQDLFLLQTLNNQGTLIASNGFLGVEGGGITNLSAGTLTGGAYIAQGFSNVDNILAFGFNFQATLAVDAANLVLDGRASLIEGYSGSSFVPLEQQLQTIASGGTLQLLDNRGYSTTNVLTDNGLLVLQDGTLATGGLASNSQGTLSGFGMVTGSIGGLGTIIATGAALDITQNTGSVSAYTATSGATLVLNGGLAGTINNSGAVYVASGELSVTGSITGSGTLNVENGAELAFGGSLSQQIAFDGSNATLDLLNPSGFTGALVGFGQGDVLELNVGGGTVVTGATVSGSSLVLMDNSTTIDTFHLAGSYQPNSSFSISSPGAGQFALTYNGPAPMRQDFGFTISVNDTAGLGAAEDNAIVNDLSAAAQDWAQYLTGYTTLRIQLNIVAGTGGSELANAGATEDIGTGATLDGRQLDDPTSLIALTTGNYAPGLSSDITVNFLAGNLGSIYVNPLPTPMPSGSVPSGQFDLVTVFRHELAHGLGFGGLTTSNGSLGSQETLFDHYIQDIGGTIDFTGPHAEAAYAVLLGTDVPTPVPLTTLSNGEGYAHFANSTLDANANDLMSGLGLPPATQRDISAMDIAVLEDVGAPVTAMPCFAAGTRIATARDNVAVEALVVGDEVLTVGGVSLPIIWIGHRRVDCSRHPAPRRVWPVRISAEAFGDGMPCRDLWLSPDHAVFVDHVLIPVKHLINGDSVVQVPMDRITYYHVELAQHAVLLAEGLPAESYLDTGDRANFTNGGRSIALYPDLATRIRDAASCAPLVVTGKRLEAARAKIRSPNHHQHAASDR